MRFSVDLFNRQYEPIPWPAGVEVIPMHWGWDAVGGPNEASVELRGPHAALVNVLEWGRFSVRIVNDRGIAVWWGYIADASVGMGAYAVGTRIDRMYNRCSVAYTYMDADGAEQRGTTAWERDAYNVLEYGQRELRYSRTGIEEDDADELVAALVDRYKDPAPYFAEGERSRESATLICSGWWSVLGWRYFDQPDGWEGHDDAGSGTQVVGVGTTSDSLVFREATSRIHNMGMEHGFHAGDKIVISGTSSNNGHRTVDRAVTVDTQVVLTATTISFEPSDDIWDSNHGFDDLVDGDWITVEGSASNDGVYQLKSIEDSSDPASTNYDHIEVDLDPIMSGPNPIATEAAGASVTIRRDGYLSLEDAVVDESPTGATITAYGVIVAQKFSLTEYNNDWEALEVQVRIRRVGSPADLVRLSIHSDNAGEPGTELDYVTMSGLSVPINSGWVSFVLPTGVTMTSSGVFWIEVQRTGANDPDDYYELAVDEDTGYGNGTLLLWDGSAWQSRPTDADLLFQVWGRMDNGEQLKLMLEYAGFTASALFTNVILKDQAGRVTRQFRDGETLVSDEVTKLLEQGTHNGTRYLAEVNQARVVSIFKKPSLDDLPLRYQQDGRITHANGAPLELGSNIAGQWMVLDDKDLPASVASGFIIFVESAEYHAGSNKWRPRPENIPDPFEFATLIQG